MDVHVYLAKVTDVATCKTCGNHNPRLPECWPNWDCLQCFAENMYSGNPEMLAKIHRARDLYQSLRSINNEIVKLEIEVALEVQNGRVVKRND